MKVIALFRALQADAAKGGGRVIVTMGNHEAEFLADPDNDKKAVRFVAELKDKGITPRQVADGTDSLCIGQFLRSLPFAARIDDWFFAHAGKTDGQTLDALDLALRDGVDRDGYGAKILARPDTILTARLHDPGPWWEWPSDTPEQSRDRLRDGVIALGAKHLVIGHQPGHVDFSDHTSRKKGTVFQKFDGLIFLIDVGMSRATELDLSKGRLLRIEPGASPRVSVIHHDGERDSFWP